METIIIKSNNQYVVGKGVYEITRVFNKEKTLKDIILEKITNDNNNSHN